MLPVSLIQKVSLFQGTKGSEAIAGAIFGAASPGSGSGYVERFGRLPYTIYPAGWADDSPMDEMDLAKWPGRTYRYAQTPPLYSFAHGLQVAQFELSVGAHPSRLSTSDLDDASPASYHLSLKSQASSRYHAEAVVVAFLFPEVLKGGPHPLKQQMVGFQRVTTPLAPGASTPLEFSLNATDLSIVDPVSGDRILSPGEYTVVFSTGSRTANVTLQIDGPRRVLQPFPAAAKADDEQLPRAKMPMPFPYQGFDSFPASFFGADIWGVENQTEMALVAKHQVAGWGWQQGCMQECCGDGCNCESSNPQGCPSSPPAGYSPSTGHADEEAALYNQSRTFKQYLAAHPASRTQGVFVYRQLSTPCWWWSEIYEAYTNPETRGYFFTSERNGEFCWSVSAAAPFASSFAASEKRGCTVGTDLGLQERKRPTVLRRQGDRRDHVGEGVGAQPCLLRRRPRRAEREPSPKSIRRHWL